jgi:hypothetical protein
MKLHWSLAPDEMALRQVCGESRFINDQDFEAVTSQQKRGGGTRTPASHYNCIEHFAPPYLSPLDETRIS